MGHDVWLAARPTQGELVIIDVSQSVDLDHPKALDFLREDCKHVNHFFKTKGKGGGVGGGHGCEHAPSSQGEAGQRTCCKGMHACMHVGGTAALLL